MFTPPGTKRHKLEQLWDLLLVSIVTRGALVHSNPSRWINKGNAVYMGLSGPSTVTYCTLQETAQGKLYTYLQH